MNTERDNFHDWARDKPDSTSFSGLHRLEQRRPPPVLMWGRIGTWVAIAIGIGAGIKYFFST